MISYAELLHFIAGSLGIHDKKENTLELLDQIKQVLLAARRRGIDYVLIVDEAHLFPDANLEQVRLLSNIEIPESKLLQILLVGQNELSHNLNRPEMRQLRQRININRFLSPLTPAETVAYIDYRLERVGSSFAACFEPNCDKLLYQLTGGVPRLINQLCDNALLGGMADGLQKVNRRVLERAHEALRTDVIFAPPGHKYPGLPGSTPNCCCLWQPLPPCWRAGLSWAGPASGSALLRPDRRPVDWKASSRPARRRCRGRRR